MLPEQKECIRELWKYVDEVLPNNLELGQLGQLIEDIIAAFPEGSTTHYAADVICKY